MILIKYYFLLEVIILILDVINIYIMNTINNLPGSENFTDSEKQELYQKFYDKIFTNKENIIDIDNEIIKKSSKTT